MAPLTEQEWTERFRREMGAHLAEGRIKSKEYVVEGLENGPRGASALDGQTALTTCAAFVDMMSGTPDAVVHTLIAQARTLARLWSASPSCERCARSTIRHCLRAAKSLSNAACPGRTAS